ncbi:Bax inhibitor-1/YccA family protein [Phytohalomonas tamaricis]|uniref:Bax inhibitor-1/YccA family protein n=1 Tax=Phytohalomonas tamaricis TaxID=2081032 RepID=UPI000D0B6E58|nr:Bax inhibitor-1/YccA family protein [Phytohalomonas tamaricis]
MANQTYEMQQRAGAGAVDTHKVLRNTYMLLSMTLLFSAVTAWLAMAMSVGRMNIFVFFMGAYGLMFLVHKLQNSAAGILAAFAFTGFMGFTLGPVLNMYLSLPNGAGIVMTALGMTGITFAGLSAVALITRKDFSFLGNFILAGAIVLVLAMVAALVFNITGLALVVSAGFVLFSSAVILYETSQLVHGGQTNYILATISLYVAIYNLFISLLSLLGFASDD